MKTIYKIRSRKDEFHKSILKKHELFFADPFYLNDIYDPIQVTNFYPYLETETARIIFYDGFIARFITSNFDFNPNHKRYFGSYDNLKSYIEKVKHYIDSLNHSKKSVQIPYTELLLFAEYYTELSRLIERTHQSLNSGICSFTQNISNILMWSHYGDNHRGFAVGFNLEIILNNFPELHAGNVKYSEKIPSKPPDEKTIFECDIDNFFLKSKDWEYEQEFRLIKHNSSGLKHSDRILKLPDEAIVEIVLGASIIDDGELWDLEEIVNEAKKRNIPLKRMYTDYDLFKLGMSKNTIPAKQNLE